MIPQEYIQEVVRRNDIEEIIGQYVQLRRRGRTATGLCPFHNEKTPSFVVYPDTQSFYCFGCGAAGDVISFVRKYNNLGYVEAVKQLASRAGMPLPEEDDRESRARQRLLEIKDYEKCTLWCDRAMEQYPRVLSSYTCQLKLCFSCGNKEKFFQIMQELRSSDIIIDNETLELIRTFM